jgi:hypothetical protein
MKRLSLLLVFVVAALSLSPALAVACAPVLNSVTFDPSGHPTYSWSLPQNVTSQFFQTSKSAEVDENGYFPTLWSFNTLEPAQLAATDAFSFSPGTYYVHIAGHDRRCNGRTCPPVEFSEVMSFDVAQAAPAAAAAAGPATRQVQSAALECTATAGGGAPLPDTRGTGVDKIRPLQNLSFAPVQDIDKLFVRARMSEPGTLKARATVTIGGASKVYRFKPASKSVRANVFTKLRLRLVKKKNLKAVKRVLKKKKNKGVKAKITVTAIDKAGNKRAQKASVLLRN